MSEPELAPDPVRRVCASCGLELHPRALDCPSCRALVHADELRAAAAEGEAAVARADTGLAIQTYRHMLTLLPRGSRQAEQITTRLTALTDRGPELPPPPARTGSAGGKFAGLGAVGLLLWKLKSVLLLALGKGKFILLGLTKASTFFSMLASFGLYWALWGWKLAAGLLLSIYVHEMGHVAALKRLGIAASAPMFIPGFGAVVRLHQYPATPREDATAGLAGPLWGLYAAIGSYVLGRSFDAPVLLAVAQLGAQINVFNLIPLGSLDGGRGFRAIAKRERWLIVAACVVLFLFSGQPMLALVGAGAGFAATREAPERSDLPTVFLFVFLLVTLTGFGTIHVPRP